MIAARTLLPCAAVVVMTDAVLLAFNTYFENDDCTGQVGLGRGELTGELGPHHKLSPKKAAAKLSNCTTSVGSITICISAFVHAPTV